MAMANPGEVFDKYIFIKVFVKVWDRAAKVEHTIRGFELSGIYLLNPAKVKMGKTGTLKSVHQARSTTRDCQ